MRFACFILAGICVLLGCAAGIAPAFPGPGFLAVVAWAVCVTAAGTAAARMATVLFPEEILPIRLLAAVILFQAEAAGVVTWLGWAGTLTVAAQLMAVGLLALFAALPGVKNRFPEPGASSESGVSRSYICAALAVGGLACAQVGLEMIRYLPVDSDNMWYHLPMVAEWIRSRTIRPAEAIPLIARSYPGFHEAVMTFLSLPLGNEYLALPGLWELPTFGLACGLLARALGVPVPAACAAGAYVVTAHQTTAAVQGNDLCLALGMITAVLFLVRFIDKEKWADAILAGVALGITAATKYNGLIYAGLFAGLFGAAHILARLRSKRTSAAGQTLLAWTVAIALFCLLAGPWYLRNLLISGNPLYPAEIAIAGTVVFPGPYSRAYFAPTTLKWDLWPLIENRSHFVQAFGLLIPLVAVAAIVALIRAVVRLSWRPVDWVVLSLPMVLFLLFLHQPYNRPSFGFGYNMRYLLGWFGVILAAALTLLRLVPPAVQQLATGILLAGAVVNTASWTSWWLVYGVAAVCGAATGFFLTARFAAPRWLFRVPAVAWVALLGTGVLLGGNGVAWLRKKIIYSNEYGYRDSPSSKGWGAAARFVHRELTGERVAVVGDNRFFPFYGDRFSNAVFPFEESVSSADEVYARARSVRATVLVCLRKISGRTGLREYQFQDSVGADLVRQHPDNFEVLFAEDGVYVLRLHRRD